MEKMRVTIEVLSEIIGVLNAEKNRILEQAKEQIEAPKKENEAIKSAKINDAAKDSGATE